MTPDARLRPHSHERLAVLFVFEADGFIPEHRTDGEVTIHVLAGCLEVTVDGDVLPLGRGGLVTLAPKQAHAVRATEASDMLLTVCRIPAAAPTFG